MTVLPFPSRSAPSSPAATEERSGALEHGGPPEVLLERAQAAVAVGELQRAAVLYQRAADAARERGESELADRASASRAALALELLDADPAMAGRVLEAERGVLRAILARTQDGRNRWLASYNLARSFELDKNWKKAHFYGCLALDAATLGKRAEWQASAHNLIGNLHLAESRVGAATDEYGRALCLLPAGERSPRRGRILDNLGYCRVLEGRHREGFRLLFESLRLLRALGARHYTISTHIDLCFAYLEVERPDPAQRHGCAAVALAERFGDRDGHKNALYLLGDAEHGRGRTREAEVVWTELQRAFYPDNPHLVQQLLHVGVRSLVNLKG